MTSALKRQVPLLEGIARFPLEEQGVCIANLKNGTMKAICKCLKDVLNGNGPMSLPHESTQQLRGYLKPYRSKLKVLVAPKTSLVTKRRLFRKKGGAIFSTIIAALLPLIISKIVALVTKKKK